MVIRHRAVSQQQKAIRRQAILAEAWQMFQETSYQQVNMAEVAKRAGIAKGTVYLYFKTKEELFLALQTQAFEAWFDRVDKALQSISSKDAIGQFIELMGASFDAQPALVRLIAILHTILEQNIDFTTALAFKQMLRERVLQTGSLLEAALPFLRPGEGAQLLLRIHAMAIGFQHLAEPAPVVKGVLEKPGLDIFNINFKDEFLTTLSTLLEGLKHTKEAR